MRAARAAALAVATTIAAGAPAAEPAPWAVDAGASTVRFTAELFGGKVHGGFERFEAEISLDPAHLERSVIRARIDPASVFTHNAERDAELRKEPWFDVAGFPQARFESRTIRRTGDTFETVGVLSLRGVEREVRFPFDLTLEGQQARLRGRATLDRSEYGIGGGKWNKPGVVGKTVEVEVDIRARVPAAPAAR